VVRSSAKLKARAWASHARVEVVEADLADRDRLAEAMRGCGAAYYLVHSMLAAADDFANQDRLLAESFATAAGQAGLSRIIYLGGLGESGATLSEHLSSRREVEEALASGPVPVTVLRAAMILGSGSASFEILRYLVERLPLMITPRWVNTECQPIAVRNVLHYLVACLHEPRTTGATLDIGGPEIHNYRTLVQTMAKAAGLRRRVIVPVPLVTPRLSSWVIHALTPVTERFVRPLAEGMRNRVVCRDDRAVQLMPQRLLPVEEAITLALGRIQADEVETRWSDAGPMPDDPDWTGGTVFSDRRTIIVQATPESVFRAACRVGGDHGWYGSDWLWRFRAILDRSIGGPGMRGGRRSQERLGVGDAVDFWRVSALEQDRRLELSAEMKLPGDARLEFLIEPEAQGSRLIQTARFRPRGLTGIAYWYAMVLPHMVVFPRVLRGIARAAERETPVVTG
jgi:uncharacterized protein YbjT (DUF2867 family)